MEIKAIMVDVDGVLIGHSDGRRWSADLERDIGISAATLQLAFFSKHWNDVVHGRASLRERLAPVLREVAPDVTCDELINYWFSHDAHVNKTLLAELSSLRREGIEIHLATVQEHERARYLWDNLGFRDSFDGLHYAAELGCSKPAAMFYRSIEARTCFRPQDLFLIDDRRENVDGAIASGWAAARWTGRDSLRSLMPTNASERIDGACTQS